MSQVLHDKHLDGAHDQLSDFDRAHRIVSDDPAEAAHVLDVLKKLDWSVAAVRALVDDLVGGAGAIGHMQDALRELKSAQKDLKKGWTGEAADQFQRMAKVVEDNHHRLEHVLTLMVQDLGSENGEPRRGDARKRSAIEVMTDLTKEVEDKAGHVKDATGDAVKTILSMYGRPDFGTATAGESAKKWADAGKAVKDAFAELRHCVDHRIERIHTDVLPTVSAHVKRVTLHDPAKARP